jgi:hypothetical protein
MMVGTASLTSDPYDGGSRYTDLIPTGHMMVGAVIFTHMMVGTATLTQKMVGAATLTFDPHDGWKTVTLTFEP